MITRMTARPTTGAGHPTHTNQEPPMNYRSIERILTAIDGGHIHLNPTRDYIDQRTMREANDPVYAAEDRGFITLHQDGRIEVTEAGRRWMGRERKRARKSLAPTFMPPAAA